MYHTIHEDGTRPLVVCPLLAADPYNNVSSAKILHNDFVNSGRSFMKIVNKIGPKMLPCGIPLKTDVGSDIDLPTLTLCNLLSRNDLIHFKILPVTLYSFSFVSNLMGYTIKCLRIVKYTTLIDSLLSSINVKSSITCKG